MRVRVCQRGSGEGLALNVNTEKNREKKPEWDWNSLFHYLVIFLGSFLALLDGCTAIFSPFFLLAFVPMQMHSLHSSAAYKAQKKRRTKKLSKTQRLAAALPSVVSFS